MGSTMLALAKGISAEVINIHTIKPLDEEIFKSLAKQCIVTAEEHNILMEKAFQEYWH
jgi:transketolase C-terminal domain/subunit